jgi:ATP/maltotriose-dependent transcriptional regulator MalT
MLDIVELQRKLTENRNQQIEQQQQQSINFQQYRLRTAALEKEKGKERQKQAREREVVELLNEGYNADQASYILDIPLSEVARIEEYNQRRRKFLMTGILDLPDQMVGISYFQ